MSLLTFSFNDLWAKALNARNEHGIDRFVMLHSDIQPLASSWIDDLLDELNRTDADVLSAVIAIKDHNGLTSTAIDTHLFRPRRLTFTEIAELPETFGGHDLACIHEEGEGCNVDLLINTGLMAIRFDHPWVEQACFSFTDRIVKRDGKYIAEIEPEDWKFSRWCHSQGLKVLATKKIKASHFGIVPFGNDRVWGTMKTDELNGGFSEEQ